MIRTESSSTFSNAPARHGGDDDTKRAASPFLSPRRASETAAILHSYRTLRHVRQPTRDGTAKRVVTEGRNFAVCVLNLLATRLQQLKAQYMSFRDRNNGTLSREKWYRLIHDAIIDEHKKAVASRSVEANEDFWHLVADTSGSGVARFKTLLTSLVATFDITDQGHASWANFTDFLSECALRGPVLPDEEDIRQYQPRAVCNRMPRRIFGMRWQPSVSRLVILSDDDRPAHIEEKLVTQSTHVEFMYRLASGDYSPKISVATVPFAVTSIEVLEHLGTNTIVTSASDLHLRLFDFKGSGPELLAKATAGETNTIMRWSPQWQRLWCAGSSIATWRMPSDILDTTPLTRLTSTSPHSSTITQLKFLPTDGSVLSCSMDPKLIIQDPNFNTIVAEFQGHTSAVTDADFSITCNLLASCGFDSDIYLWTTHGERRSSKGNMCMKPLVQLRDANDPHSPPYVAVHAIPDTPQLVSIDTTGRVKIWDLRTFQCAQTFSADTKTLLSHDSLTGSVLTWECGAFITHSSSTLRPVEYTARFSNYVRETAEDTIVSLFYSPAMDALVSATQGHVQTWEVRTSVKSSEVAVTSEAVPEVTCMGIDAMGRKVVLGHRGGLVSFYSATTGRPCGRRNLGDVDIVDVCGYGSNGVAFAVDDLGSCFCVSDEGEAMPTFKFERNQGAKFLRVNSQYRCVLIFHGNAKVHVYHMRPERHSLPQFVQVLDVAASRSEAPPDSTPDLHATDVPQIAVGGDVSAAQIVTIPNDDRVMLLLVADSYNYISLFGGLRAGSTISELVCIGRWYYDSADIAAMSFDWASMALVVANASSLVSVYDASSWATLVPHVRSQTPVTDSRLLHDLPRRGSARSTIPRPTSLVILSGLGLLLVGGGERVIQVLPLTLGSENYGSLSLDRSLVTFPSGTPLEELGRLQQDILRTGKAIDPAASPRGEILPASLNHPNAPQAEDLNASYTMPLSTTYQQQSFLTQSYAYADHRPSLSHNTRALMSTLTLGSELTHTESMVIPARIDTSHRRRRGPQTPFAPSRVATPNTAASLSRPGTVSLEEAALASRAVADAVFNDSRTSHFTTTGRNTPVTRRELRERSRRLAEATWFAVRAPRDIPMPAQSPVQLSILSLMEKLETAAPLVEIRRDLMTPNPSTTTTSSQRRVSSKKDEDVQDRGATRVVTKPVSDDAGMAQRTLTTATTALPPSRAVVDRRLVALPAVDRRIAATPNPTPAPHSSIVQGGDARPSRPQHRAVLQDRAHAPTALADEKLLTGGQTQVCRLSFPALKSKLPQRRPTATTPNPRTLPTEVGIFLDV